MSGDLYPSLESLKPVRLHAKLEIALHSKTNQEKLVASSGPAFRIRHWMKNWRASLPEVKQFKKKRNEQNYNLFSYLILYFLSFSPFVFWLKFADRKYSDERNRIFPVGQTDPSPSSITVWWQRWRQQCGWRSRSRFSGSLSSFWSRQERLHNQSKFWFSLVSNPK